MKLKSKILIIAGSDSSGGAGIQADIKTITALGSYAMTAITAVTSQNTTGVKSIVSIPPKEIMSQIIFTSKDIKTNAIKIGMWHSSKVIDSVIKCLNKIKVKKIVLDPVMIAKGGTKLIDNSAINLIKVKLIKRVALITPNIPEAEILTGIKIYDKYDMIVAANKLIDFGAQNVLLKGGHLKSKKVEDVFLSKSDLKVFVKISASGIFGVINVTLLNNFNLKDLIAFLSINLAPPFATITGSSTIFLIFILSSDLTMNFITFSECSIPILIASGLISFEVNMIWFEISLGGIGMIDLTPLVFWEVTAVIAVIAYDPRAVTVLISAWMPAPPDESDPAIINIFDLGFSLFYFFWDYIYTLI